MKATFKVNVYISTKNGKHSHADRDNDMTKDDILKAIGQFIDDPMISTITIRRNPEPKDE